MPKIACHTLGCKVNQYDTQAMLELFEKAGYESVPFEAEADVYLVNTCTVTGVGDQKSLKLIRRVHRERARAGIIVAGCLAQRDAERVSLPGVRLVIGVKNRARVVELYETALREDRLVDATREAGEWTFENLSVVRHEGKTRAVMKIQEGCDRYCAYCVIPYVRGPLRSMAIADIRREAQTLAAAGYREIVLTGIHLASFGKNGEGTLLEAIRAVHEIANVARIRLGSLEPVVADAAFLKELKDMPKVCPQFHLSLQSGSDAVLARMRRRYTAAQYQAAVARLREAFPGCAITTDVLTGFPGETEEEAKETLDFVREIAFARIHVFPYSLRQGTLAARMPMQVPEEVKQARAAALIALGNQLEEAFVQKLVGTSQTVLFEQAEGEWAEGYTTGYVRVRAKARPGELREVSIVSAEGRLALGATI